VKVLHLSNKGYARLNLINIEEKIKGLLAKYARALYSLLFLIDFAVMKLCHVSF
jgi:hypothetical protein